MTGGSTRLCAAAAIASSLVAVGFGVGRPISVGATGEDRSQAEPARTTTTGDPEQPFPGVGLVFAGGVLVMLVFPPCWRRPATADEARR
jgi:hypothetical protein